MGAAGATSDADLTHDQSSLRVRWRTTVLVVIPSSQPSTAEARMIQTSEAWVEPTTQSSLTAAVFAAARAISTTISTTSKQAQV